MGESPLGPGEEDKQLTHPAASAGFPSTLLDSPPLHMFVGQLVAEAALLLNYITRCHCLQAR